jgi:hypothetical protein
MTETPLTYEQLEMRLAAWAQTEPAVRAVLVVGSRARGDADRWSDMDVLLLTTERDRYATDSAWLGEFGDLWLAYAEPTDLGDPEWYAVYEGGLKLDVVMIQIDEPAHDLETLMQPLPYQGVFGRGVRVLFDRNGAARTLPPKPFVPDAPPSAAEFGQVVSGFLMASATTAKFIARGDFWRAQNWFAADLRTHLLTMLRWQALGQDTWYGGRFMEQWADPRALAALPVCFPAFERESLQTSLLGMLGLFRAVGGDTAVKFGFEYPADAHEKIAALVGAIFRVE